MSILAAMVECMAASIHLFVAMSLAARNERLTSQAASSSNEFFGYNSGQYNEHCAYVCVVQTFVVGPSICVKTLSIARPMIC